MLQTAAGEEVNCTDGDVRLVGGKNSSEGNVQMCHNHAWTSICGNEWDVYDANVVCQELGFQAYGNLNDYCNYYNYAMPLLFLGSTFYTKNYFQVSINPSFVYGTFSCFGNEQLLYNCPRDDLSSLLTCHRNDIAGVKCEG